MTWLYIEPSDVWMFRDARPFPTDQGLTARSMFPPSPFTVQGALRSSLLGRLAVSWHDYAFGAGAGIEQVWARLGRPGASGSAGLGQFAMRGPVLGVAFGQSVELRFPLPADAFALGKTKVGSYQLSSPKPAKSRSWRTNRVFDDAQLSTLEVDADVQPEGIEAQVWLDGANLERYLAGDPFEAAPSGAFVANEPRLGIEIDHGPRRPKDGQLYTAEFVRLHNDVGLVVEVSDTVEWPSAAGVLAMGGQARAAHYRSMAAPNLPGQRLHNPQTLVRVLLLTPAYFEAGWRPASGDWSEVFGVEARLVSVALGRPLSLGGWDLANPSARHKPMYNFVPAGSVFYFEFRKAIGSLDTPFTQSPDGGLPLGRLGFGMMALGTWAYR
jgi:CRISPR-associated protein Cmr3